MRTNRFDNLGSISSDLLILSFGILFFLRNLISWKILEVVFLVYCFYAPSRLIVHLIRQEKDATRFDYLVILVDYAMGIAVIANPDLFFHFTHLFMGLWMLGHGIILMINFYVRIRDRLPGAAGQFFASLASLVLAVFLIFSSHWADKTALLSIFAGIYFCFYGLIGLAFHLVVTSPRSTARRRYNWSYSAPVLLNALLPLHVYVSVRHLIKDSTLTNLEGGNHEDLNVYIYLNAKGGESFGHTDISYQGKIYSYGCHDPKHRRLAGTLGDGVLIVSDEKKFLTEALHGENKIIISFGIRLNEDQKHILEHRIREIMSRAVPWKCALAEAEEAGETYDGFMDYASRVYAGTHADMYKFSRGKFRTYFVAYTNCVLLADELIRSNELLLIDINGLVTPGAYLSFLNTEYLKKNTIVVSRTLYKSGLHEAA